MSRAARLLQGRHDFRLLCESPSEQPSTIVVVESASVEVDGGLVLVRLVASHFLWKMVRRVVGCLVRVGGGEMAAEDLDALLRGKPLAGGKPAEWTAPPSGLFLERVLYDGDPPLGPVRAAVPVPEEPQPPETPARARRPR
jgi:tRNA pseudouridine38-40 synthase